MFNKLGGRLFFLLLGTVLLYGTKFAVYDQETRINVAPVVNCKVIRILCFGDSLTSGFSTTTVKLHPYSTRLQECFDSNNSTMLAASLSRPIFEVHNAGMPGEPQAAQTLFVIYIRGSIALRFKPFKRMYENGSKIALNSTCSRGFK